MFDDNIIYEYPFADRIIIIGDIHGDLKRFKNILIDAGIINKDIKWIASPPNTVIVQLGDQVDSLNRVPFAEDWEVIDDIEIIKFTEFLDNIARPLGGKVISLIGNHELMNTFGNFSYVSQKSLISESSRYSKFKPGGDLSYLLSKRPIIIKIGDLLFCHAGIKKTHIDVLQKNKKDVSYINTLWRNYILTNKINIEDKEIFDTIILDQGGILWNRELDDFQITKEILENLGCTYMFIGHNTVNKIVCDKNNTWYVDTGISRAYGLDFYEYIDIKEHIINVKRISDT